MLMYEKQHRNKIVVNKCIDSKKGTSIDFLKLWEVWMGVAMFFQGENDFHGIPRVKHLNFTHSANGPR